jgi:hypothetical protein
MALSWCWAYGQESGVDLVAMEWTLSSTSSAVMEPRTTHQYTYAGSPTRYSWAMDHGSWVRPPASAVGPQGAVAVAVYHDGVPQNGQYLLDIRGASNNRYVAAIMQATGAVKLYVDNTFKATTSVIPWQGQWHYVSLAYRMTTTTWAGKLYVDGVLLVSAIDSGVAQTDSTVQITGTANGDRTQYLAQIAIFDDFLTTGEVARYITRFDVDADVSEVGTWTPSAGATNFGVVGGTFDAATYTEEAVPSASDDVIVDLSTDLATKLGITPTAIDGVTCHTYSNGLGQTARAEVGDQVGTTTTTGDTGAISSGTTERHATAVVKPSGGAWAGTDTPKGKYFIVTV